MLKILCGKCDEELPVALDHDCYQSQYLETDLDNIRYSTNGYVPATTELALGYAFLKANPEFRDNESDALNDFRRVGTGLTREHEDWITPVDYEAESGLPYVPEFTQDITREDEWDGIYELRSATDKGDYGIPYSWRDVENTRCTHAVHWWRKDRIARRYEDAPHMPVGFTEQVTYAQSYEALDFEDPRLMRLEFNTLQGFTSSLLIDADITEAFQYKVFNAYVGRDQKFHIGLLTFERFEDRDQYGEVQQSIAVTCNHGGCHYRTNPFFSPANPTREQQEQFIHDCIRHGNNHGPAFITSRSDFTFIHATNCDTNHGRKDACNANTPRLDVNSLDPSDLNTVYGYLLHHRKFCRTSDCRCTHYYHLLSEVVTNNYCTSAIKEVAA